MDLEKLRVLSRGKALVPDYEQQAAGRRAFVGTDCRAIGETVESTDIVVGPHGKAEKVMSVSRGAVFVRRVAEVVEVPNRREYRQHVQEGDLWPADQETADACGVKFDATYGGEHSAEVKAVTTERVAQMQKAVAAQGPKKG